MTDRHGPVADEDLDGLIHRVDLDGLVRLIDARCESRDWAGLLRVRDRARHALSTGRQVWPAATLAEYRLALLAPPEWAAIVLDEEAGRFTIGPLTEVVAQHHAWAELAPLLPAAPRTVFVAHERALRGEVVDTSGLPDVLDVPASIRAWEPEYALAIYHDADAEFPTPSVPRAVSPVEVRAGAERLDDEVVELAVRQLVDAWITGSNGRVEVVCVEGDAAGALGAMGLARARVAPMSAPEAIAWLAWAGASGGAHGRRRGAASGRAAAWWVLGALGDLHDEWPPSDDAVADVLGDLRWWWWDADEPVSGWRLQLAIEDVASGVAWALTARDDA
jgi:hypothetical protein